jgi:hypothetical protein
MNASDALKIVEPLANGINPFNGEIFEKDKIFQNPMVVRALFRAIDALKGDIRREKRKKNAPERAGQPWNEKEDEELAKQFDNGMSIKELASRHKRTRVAIESRLERLGKIESKNNRGY